MLDLKVRAWMSSDPETIDPRFRVLVQLARQLAPGGS